MIAKRQAFEGIYCCIFVFLFLFGGFSLSVAHAATYYVNSQNGNDSRTTTQAQNASTPWLTIQKCANNTVAGDTCSVASGTYNERPNAATIGGTGNPSNGTCDTRITFISSTARTATVLGFDINANCIRVEGFNVANPSDTCTGPDCLAGIDIYNSYAQVVNNYISNWRDQAAIASGNSQNLVWATRPSWGYIANNTIYHSQNGLAIWGDNFTVDSNEVNRLYTYVSSDDSDYSRAWGIGNTFTNNFFHGTIVSEIGASHVDCMQTWYYHSGYLKNFTWDKNWCSESHETISQSYGSTNCVEWVYYQIRFCDFDGEFLLNKGYQINGTKRVNITIIKQMHIISKVSLIFRNLKLLSNIVPQSNHYLLDFHLPFLPSRNLSPLFWIEVSISCQRYFEQAIDNLLSKWKSPFKCNPSP